MINMVTEKPKEKIDYRVIEANGLEMLCRRVVELLNNGEGWELQGGISSEYAGSLYQAAYRRVTIS